MPRRESELCEELMARARREGWLVYPETAGFDLLLVATGDTLAVVKADRFARRRNGHRLDGDVAPGDMIGVEAKLAANVEVLAQAVDRGFANRTRTGPDFRVADVPRASRSFRDLASILHVGVWTLKDARRVTRWASPLAPHPRRWYPHKRPTLPPVVPTGPAGAPSPRPCRRPRPSRPRPSDGAAR